SVGIARLRAKPPLLSVTKRARRTVAPVRYTRQPLNLTVRLIAGLRRRKPVARPTLPSTVISAGTPITGGVQVRMGTVGAPQPDMIWNTDAGLAQPLSTGAETLVVSIVTAPVRARARPD